MTATTTRTVDSAELKELCINLKTRRASRVVTRLYDEALRESGLNSGQFTLMTLVFGEADISIGKLADELGMDRTTVLAALKPLVTRGFMKVSRSPRDRRARVLAVTPQGQAALSQAGEKWRNTQKHVVATIGEQDALSLRSGLDHLAVIG